MKAKNEKSPANVEVQDGEVSLIKATDLQKKFNHLTGKIEIFKEYAIDIIIDSEETLTVAENNSSQINETLKNIETVRVEVKKPYFNTVKDIDAFAKTLSEPLSKAKKDINESITNWKTVQTAAARATAEKVQKDAEVLVDEKAAEVERINRIEMQLIAKLYGGHWFNRNQQKLTSAGCFSTKDCDILMDLIKTKIPEVEDFPHMKDEYNVMKKDILKKLSKHKMSLIESESESKTIRESAAKQIDQAKTEAGIEVNDKKDEMTKEIIKEAKSTIKTANAEVKEAGKGVRKNLKFEVADIDEVPTNWILLNDPVIRAWAQENKDYVRKVMKESDGVIQGIKFYLEDAFASR